MGPHEQPRPGTMLSPNLRLHRPLGAGGMGSVWIAQHLGLRTKVVVKMISDELARNPEALSRFSREASAAARVKSPHVVHMIDYGVAEGVLPFIAMELLEGRDLRSALDEQRVLDPGQVVTIVTHVARALMAAQQCGIVHRDIKPENIFLTDAGGGDLFVKVLDFGVAKSTKLDAATMAHTSAQTKMGAMLGTPSYMSPEQVRGLPTIDHRTDLWSLGVVVFEALTGAPPFLGETIGALSLAICYERIPLPSERNPALGPSIDAWFMRACAREAADRFGTAREMADSLAAAVAAGAQVARPKVIFRSNFSFDDDDIGVPATAMKIADPSSSAAIPLAPAPASSAATPYKLPSTLGTAAVVGAAAPEPTPRSRGLALAIAGGIVAIGALAGVGVAIGSQSTSRSAGETEAAPAAEAAPAPKKKAKPAPEPAASEPVATESAAVPPALQAPKSTAMPKPKSAASAAPSASATSMLKDPKEPAPKPSADPPPKPSVEAPPKPKPKNSLDPDIY